MQIKEIQIFKIIINNKHKKFIFLSFLFSVFFVFQIFKFLSRDQFIFSGDMYFPLSIDEIVKNFFFVFALNDFGDFDGIKSILSFFDNLLFFFLYLISQNIHLVQILYFFFLFFSFFLINYFSFVSINSFFKNNKDARLNSFLITIIYVSLPYFSLNFHGGIVNLSFILSYSLAPLSIFYFYKLCSDSFINLKRIVFLTLIIYAMSFAFWLICSLLFIFFFIFAIFFYENLNKKNFNFFYNILIFLFLYLLVFFPQIYLLYNHFYKFIDIKLIDDTSSYGNLFGGLIYQIMMYFSWAVYYDFTPRGFFPFKDYYFSIFYYLGILFLYLAAFVGAISSYKKNNKKKLSLILLFSLFLFIFFAKGSQPPFGYIYENLMSLNLFKIFRTPDNRFGFGISVCIILLVFFGFNKMDRFNKTIISLLIFLILGYPIYSGKWIRGDYKVVEYDRIIKINNHLRDLSNFIDENLKKNDQYIYIINGSVYEFYNINNSEYYRGQDLLPKLQRKTILYNDNINGGNFKNNLSKIENSNYFLYRRDLRNKNIKLEDFEINVENLNKIYSNDLYDLFERKNKTSLFFNDINLKYNLSWIFLFKINGLNPYIKISNNHEFYLCKIDNYTFMNLLNELLLCNTKYKKSDNSFYRFNNLEKNNTYIFFNSIQMNFFKLSILSLLLFFFLLTYLYVQYKKK